MSNYFLDNSDLSFHFGNLDLRDIVDVLEDRFEASKRYDSAPRNYEEAVEYYRSALELFGQICAQRIAPRAYSVDTEGARLQDGKVEYAAGTLANISDLGNAGFMGVIVPREYGGIGFPATIYMMMIEMLSRADASLMTTFGYQDVGEAIAKYGTADQAREFLAQYVKGEAIGAMVMTEPGAGSDIGAIKVRAFEDAEGNWRLNGTKHFISNGNGDILLVVARSEDGTKDIFGLSLFVCKKGDKVQINKVEEKMGLHGSPTCEIYFDDAPAHLIGRRKSGMLYVLSILNHARFSVAAQALGIAEGAYREALEHAKARKQFGKFLIDMPLVADKLVDMRTDLEWMRTMLYAGAQHLDRRNALEERIEELKAEGKAFQAEKIQFEEASRILNLLSPMTKYAVTEAAVSVVYSAQQLHGGMGYMREMAVERMARDVRITTIYEGASEVQVASCANSVKADVLKPLLDEIAAKKYGDELHDIKDLLEHVRACYEESRKLVLGVDNSLGAGATIQHVVNLYIRVWVGYLLLGEARFDARKKLIAHRYIKKAGAEADAIKRLLQENIHADLEFRDTICN